MSREPSRSSEYAVDGVAAGLGGFGIATFAATGLTLFGLAGGEPIPIVALGSAMVDLTPLWLKNLAVGVFGTNDKAALWVAMAIVIVALLAGIGSLARTRHTPALLTLGALGLVPVGAVLSRPGAVLADAVPTLIGVVCAGWWLDSRLRERSRTPADGSGPSRRDALVLAGGAVGLGAISALWGRRVGGDGPAGIAEVTLPAPASTVTLAADADLGVPGAVPWQVKSGEFYRIDTALIVPRIDPAAWRLRVYGEVEQEIELTWAQLLAKPMIERWVTLACVSNEIGGDLVGNALWLGWPVRELLAMARPRPGADMVLSRSEDGWTAGTPLSALTDDRNALLAVGMNRAPLPPQHGFPVRLVVPGLYGYVSATKWITELKVTRFAVDMGYWTPRGWSALGPVKTASRIDVPRSGREVRAGLVPVAGVAWAMHRGITAVQVSVDGGPWRDARLAGEPTIDAWRQWVYDWDATPGSHTITVRAQDGAGEWQTADVARSDPDGATGHHTVTVRVA